uniref:Uncharacterized protein n=1 Tax=Proboscia inermis TaxID=420281 RepID=A0A7S0CFP4_9STRA
MKLFLRVDRRMVQIRVGCQIWDIIPRLKKQFVGFGLKAFETTNENGLHGSFEVGTDLRRSLQSVQSVLITHGSSRAETAHQHSPIPVIHRQPGVRDIPPKHQRRPRRRR